MFMKITTNLLKYVAAVACALCAALAYADGIDEPIPSFYQEPGLSPNRDYVNQHPNEELKGSG
jgi:hypothetical protein